MLIVRVLAFLILTVLTVSCASVPVLHQKGVSVAVWDLDNLSLASVSVPHLGELLSGQVIDSIQNKGDYTLVERERLLLALEELQIGTSELADEATRLKLGRLVGARLMVFGGYQIIGETMRIDLRIVDVETGAVLRAVQKTSSDQGLPGWIDTTKTAAEELIKH